ncbi:MAG: IPT/TIG domain-containing protein [Bryobacteraceae bacterium]
MHTDPSRESAPVERRSKQLSNLTNGIAHANIQSQIITVEFWKKGSLDRMITRFLPTCAALAFSAATALGAGSSIGPQVVSMGPAAGNTGLETFTLLVSDDSGTNGAQNLDVINLLINDALDGRNACYLAYAVATQTLYLVNDAGDAIQQPGSPLPGSGGGLANSKCTVDAAASAAGPVGADQYKLVLKISFTAQFAGNRIVYAAARNSAGGNSGWQLMGVHSFPPLSAAQPSAVSVDPVRSVSFAQPLTFTFSNTIQGQTWANLSVVNALINDSVNGQQACYVAYTIATGTLVLVNDAGDAGGPFAGSITIPGTGSVSNNQCIIQASGSSVAASGGQLVLQLNITFKTAFAGNRGIWLAARNQSGGNSGWQPLGSWGGPVSGGGPPSTSNQCQPSVQGVSSIEFYPQAGPSSRMNIWSLTSLPYCVALYYDPYVESYFYGHGGGLFELLASGWDIGIADAFVEANNLQIPNTGYDYELRSDHYVRAWHVVRQVTLPGGGLSNVFADFFGFSQSLVGNNSGGGSSSTQNQYLPPVNTYLEVEARYYYQGTTAVTMPTSDQTPVIDSISPDEGDPGTTVTVLISGSGFGVSPQVAFSGSGVHATVLSSGQTWIWVSVTIDAGATLGGRTVTVTSLGLSGNGFRPGPGKAAVSNAKTFKVRGTPCLVTIDNNGEKYTLGNAGNPRSARIPLRAATGCIGSVTWELTFTYQTTAGKGASRMGPYTVSDSLRNPFDFTAFQYDTPPGAGGRVDVTAIVSAQGQVSQQAATFYVDGAQIGEFEIGQRLEMLYLSYDPNRATPRLMAGLSWAESQRWQFGDKSKEFGLFGIQGLWPNESYDGGSHIGLMMVPTRMDRAFDWFTNTDNGVSLFVTDKRPRALSYEAEKTEYFSDRGIQLRSLNPSEREDNTLCYYGEAALGIRELGPYWIPIANGSGWQKNKNHSKCTSYVDKVRGHLQ